jgi:hypothetical protein
MRIYVYACLYSHVSKDADVKPPNVTLDNNCIIDLKQNREDIPQVRKLIQVHHNKEIILRVIAISASKLKQDKQAHPRYLLRCCDGHVSVFGN